MHLHFQQLNHIQGSQLVWCTGAGILVVWGTSYLKEPRCGGLCAAVCAPQQLLSPVLIYGEVPGRKFLNCHLLLVELPRSAVVAPKIRHSVPPCTKCLINLRQRCAIPRSWNDFWPLAGDCYQIPGVRAVTVQPILFEPHPLHRSPRNPGDSLLWWSHR